MRDSDWLNRKLFASYSTKLLWISNALSCTCYPNPPSRVFFSPLLLLYIATGWWQTVTVNRNKGLGFGKSWIGRFSTVHIDQYFPWGMVMAFRFVKNKTAMAVTLAARGSL